MKPTANKIPLRAMTKASDANAHRQSRGDLCSSHRFANDSITGLRQVANSPKVRNGCPAIVALRL
jgi:hypothetical protein